MFSPQQAMAVAERMLVAVEDLDQSVRTLTGKADKFIRPTYRRRVTQNGSNAGGAPANFDMNLGGPAQGYEWVIERISVVGTANQIVLFYEGDPAQGGSLIEKITIGADGTYSDPVGEQAFVGRQKEVTARLFAQAIGQGFQVSMQVMNEPADRPAF